LKKKIKTDFQSLNCLLFIEVNDELLALLVQIFL